MNRRDFIGTAASACALGLSSALLPSRLRGALGSTGTPCSIAGPGAYALAPLVTFVRDQGLFTPELPKGDLVDFRYSLLEWRLAYGDQDKPPFSRPFGYLRIIRRLAGERTIYQIDRSENQSRIRANVTREGGPEGQLTWEMSQSAKAGPAKELGLVSEIAGRAGKGIYERTVNGRTESSALAGPVAADCELLTGGLALPALAEAGQLHYLGHESGFAAPALCQFREEAAVSIHGNGSAVRLTPFGLTGPRHQPQHYLVPQGEAYATAFTEFAVSMALDSLN